jgi:hypothetical protein
MESDEILIKRGKRFVRPGTSRAGSTLSKRMRRTYNIELEKANLARIPEVTRVFFGTPMQIGSVHFSEKLLILQVKQAKEHS